MIRLATIDDAPLIAAIMMNGSVRPYISLQDRDHRWVLQRVRERFGDVLYLLFEDGEGFFCAEPVDAARGWYFVHACVRPEGRGETARRAARACERYLAAGGVSRLYGFTLEANRRARLFAFSFGMRECEAPGTWGEHAYDRGEGRWMSKDLAAVPVPEECRHG